MQTHAAPDRADGLPPRSGDALRQLELAIWAELGLETGGVRRLPPRATGWPALLGLAVVALFTDCARDTLANAWHCQLIDVDAAFQGFAAEGLVEGVGTHGLSPTDAGYGAVIRFLIDAGRLETPRFDD